MTTIRLTASDAEQRTYTIRSPGMTAWAAGIRGVAQALSDLDDARRQGLRPRIHDDATGLPAYAVARIAWERPAPTPRSPHATQRGYELDHVVLTDDDAAVPSGHSQWIEEALAAGTALRDGSLEVRS